MLFSFSMNRRESAAVNSNAAAENASATKRRLIAGLIVVVLLLLGAVFFLFDPARGGFYPVCLFHSLTGLNCPGCGSLRALHHLTHGEFLTALHCNPLLVALLPFVAFIALRWFKSGRAAFDGKTVLFRPAAVWTLLAVTVVFTILRNLPGPAFAWMSP